MPAEETNALGGDEYRLGFIESQRLRVAGSAAHLRASHGPLLTHIIASKMVQINITLMSAPIKHHHRVPHMASMAPFWASTYDERPCGSGSFNEVLGLGLGDSPVSAAWDGTIDWDAGCVSNRV